MQARASVLRWGDALGADLADHIRTCADCRQIFEADRTVWVILEEYEAPDLGTDLLPSLERRLSGAAEGRRFWNIVALFDVRKSPRRFATAAAVVFAAGLIIGAWTGSAFVTAQNSQSTRAAKQVSLNEYAAVFDIEPPGFLTDPGVLEGAEER